MIKKLNVLFFLLFLSLTSWAQSNYSYQWYKNGSEIKGATNLNYFPTETGWYSVRTINQNSCQSDKSEEMYFQCVAETPTIIQSSGFKLSSTVEAKKYIWLLNNVILSDTTKTIKIKKAGSYRLKIINSSGCESDPSSESIIAFNDQDQDGIEDSEDNCPKTPNSDQKDQDKDGIGDVCDDSDGDLVFDNKDLCPNTNPNTRVDSNGCADDQRDTDSDGINDNMDNCPTKKNPSKPEITLTSTFNLTLKTIPNNCTYQWFLETKLISGENSNVLIPKTNGNYTIQVTDSDGCRSLLSDSFQLLILSSEEKSNDIYVYPNPVIKQIKFKIPIELNGILTMDINDNLGKSQGKVKNIADSQIIELDWLKPGTYYLVFNQNGKEFIKTIKIVKE